MMTAKDAAKRINLIESQLRKYTVTKCFEIADVVYVFVAGCRKRSNVTRYIRDLAKELGKSPAYVAKYLRISRTSRADRRLALKKCDSFRSLFAFVQARYPGPRRRGRRPRASVLAIPPPPPFTGPQCIGCGNPTAEPDEAGSSTASTVMQTAESVAEVGKALFDKRNPEAMGPDWVPLTQPQEVGLRDYISQLERENADLRERIAELEDQLAA